MAPAGQDHAPLARRALRRSYPSQEPSAVIPHAGICAGGGSSPQQRRPVPTATEIVFDQGADAVVDDGRQHRWRRYREPSQGPAGSENLRMRVISPC
jgi:hypothetical protein